jgi:asparagine synthase (glutamine-hydrolysing)
MEKYIDLAPLFLRKSLKNASKILSSNRPIFRRIKKISANWDKNSLERMSGYFSWLPRNVLMDLFSDEIKKEMENYYPTEFLEQLNSEIPEETNLLNRMLYWELRSFLVDHNLNYTDKLSMAVGVEARVPFLDLELVEFSTKISPSLKLKNGVTKYVLKKVAERYLPPDIIYRPKTGFGAPVRQWILNDMEEMIKYRLSKEKLKERGIFNPEKVWELINDNKTGKIDASYTVWSLMAIESWMEQFVDSTSVKSDSFLTETKFV